MGRRTVIAEVYDQHGLISTLWTDSRKRFLWSPSEGEEPYSLAALYKFVADCEDVERVKRAKNRHPTNSRS